MGKYKIKIKVEMVECEESELQSPTKQRDGSFTMIIDEQSSLSIDKCERAFLQTAYPCIRAALSEHLSEVAKKNP